MSTPHDKHGYPVRVGDVIRTFHYRHYRNRRKMYLYHVVVEENGNLYGVPAADLARPHNGGKFLLTDESLSISEIVQSNVADEEFIERNRAM